MQKQFGTTLLIAGTCIGSGMLALPMLLAKIGLLYSTLFIVLVWGAVYYTALIGIEIHIRDRGAFIGSIADKLSLPVVGLIGKLCLKLLHYSLIAAYIYGSASVIQKTFGVVLGMEQIGCYCAAFTIALLLLPIKLIDYINRILFFCLLAIFGILLLMLVAVIDLNKLPLMTVNYSNIYDWPAILPIIFTSFGFQGSMHTIVNYCDLDIKKLKKAVFIGTLIPTVVYVIWIFSVLSVLYNYDKEFYLTMMSEDLEVGDLIERLTALLSNNYIAIVIRTLSLLAITTSLIGVSCGLSDSIANQIGWAIKNFIFRRAVAAILTVIPGLALAVLIPNAFISILGFAGMILSVIAILLPVYLFTRIKNTQPYYSELDNRTVILGAGLFGFIVIFAELWMFLI